MSEAIDNNKCVTYFVWIQRQSEEHGRRNLGVYLFDFIILKNLSKKNYIT